MPRYHSTLWKLLSENDGIDVVIEHRIEIARKVCEGLKYIQGEGLRHLDLKPTNILVNLNQQNKDCSGTKNPFVDLIQNCVYL